MTYHRSINLNAHEATPMRPFMCLWGNIGTGKTTELSAAFPDYLWIVTNASAIVGANAWNRSRGLSTVNNCLALIDRRDVKGKPNVNFYNSFYMVMARIEAAAKQRGYKYIPPIYVKPDGKKVDLFPGSPIEKRKYYGIVLSEYTTLADWIYRDAKAKKGSSYSTNDLIRDTQGRLTALHAQTGLGIILEGHQASVEYGAHDTEQENPLRPEGPKLPFRDMTNRLMKDLTQCWRIRREEGPDGNPQTWLDTAAKDTRHLALRTKINKLDPERPFTVERQSINLTAEGITVRDVMREIGFDPDSEKKKEKEADA